MGRLPAHWNENHRRGYLIAREFMLLQFFLWGALLVAGVFYMGARYDERRDTAAVFVIAFAVTYLPVQYLRAVWTAWRVWRRKEEPPEVTAEHVKDLQDVLGNLTNGR
jgi:hypothetical protein